MVSPSRTETTAPEKSVAHLRGELYDPPDARPDDEIVGQGQEKKDRHEPQLDRQDHRIRQNRGSLGSMRINTMSCAV